MSLPEILTDDSLQMLRLCKSLTDKLHAYHFNYRDELGDFLKGIGNNTSRGERKYLIKNLEKNINPHDEAENYEQWALAKALAVLELTGFPNTAKELATAMNRRFQMDDSREFYIKQIAEGAVKKSRSVAASGHRHGQRSEIISVMKNTWKAYPYGSKTRMIGYITSAYRVDDKTLKKWIKEDGIGPTRPVENRNFQLVRNPE
ncbi:hypothetical protein YK25_002075 [Salmonella enterica subsp. enterica]|uniref:Uncharacterized protein n=1 Tax=Salmonella senftenberg TaxID=28150 RepID=A0A3V2HZ57_SALSE|nr:hypothetical protein [Salmonella enterica subsp. enterica serovar Senftenberg]EAA7719919.1 hypothetical protein [Salmonella enterica]EDQ9386946.1 hypothetical protein [Salmonella enterica subsp. enterica]EDX8986835.1 hypothetical protein [Salmonella enterica subsp. enterica serovar Westhampton]MBJ3367719.1 hypothetical protein [Salmonella enterica subsp. enterica serovar Typhimurium]HAE4658257.1 hypothetical protein [Salmonella enterica subsp. enterica serovar Rough O:-:-]HCZ3814212.1 hypo